MPPRGGDSATSTRACAVLSRTDQLVLCAVAAVWFVYVYGLFGAKLAYGSQRARIATKDLAFLR